MVYIINFDKKIRKKKIFLKYFKNFENNCHYFFKFDEISPIPLKKISLSFPGYPILDKNNISHKNFVSNIEKFQHFFIEGEFLIKTKYFKISTFNKTTKIVNPYSIYIFEKYMEENYLLYNKNINFIYNHKKIMKSIGHSKIGNLFKIQLFKKFLYLAIIILLVNLKLNFIPFFKACWDIAFLLFSIKFFGYIKNIFKKYLVKTFIFTKNIERYSIVKELVSLIIFANGIIRTGNPICI